jgi:hypothetical protein
MLPSSLCLALHILDVFGNRRSQHHGEAGGMVCWHQGRYLALYPLTVDAERRGLLFYAGAALLRE